jgi:hypothetical protein
MSFVGQYKPRTPIFRVVRVPAKGYVVVDKDGAHVSSIHKNQDNALTCCDFMTAEFLRKFKRQDRACMCCGTTFPSVGIHNRMCDPCRRRPDVDISPNSIARGRR